jgi:hypothetical protein
MELSNTQPATDDLPAENLEHAVGAGSDWLRRLEQGAKRTLQTELNTHLSDDELSTVTGGATLAPGVFTITAHTPRAPEPPARRLI